MRRSSPRCLAFEGGGPPLAGVRAASQLRRVLQIGVRPVSATLVVVPSTAVDDLWRAFAQHANYAEFCPSAFGQHQPHRHAFCGWVSARSGKLRRTLYSAQDDELLHDRRQLRCCSGWTRRRGSRAAACTSTATGHIGAAMPPTASCAFATGLTSRRASTRTAPTQVVRSRVPGRRPTEPPHGQTRVRFAAAR